MGITIISCSRIGFERVLINSDVLLKFSCQIKSNRIERKSFQSGRLLMSRRARLEKKERRVERQVARMTTWAHYEMYGDDDCDDGSRADCWRCGGEGYIDGEEMAEYDPLWYDSSEIYECNCCGGSGSADDCRYW